jgi:hypothetical protein
VGKKYDLPAQFERALRILKEGGVDPDFLHVVSRCVHRAMLGPRDAKEFFCLASAIEPDSPLADLCELLQVEDMAARALQHGFGVVLAFDHPASGRASVARIQQLVRGVLILTVDTVRK